VRPTESRPPVRPGHRHTSAGHSALHLDGIRGKRRREEARRTHREEREPIAVMSAGAIGPFSPGSPWSCAAHPGHRAVRSSSDRGSERVHWSTRAIIGRRRQRTPASGRFPRPDPRRVGRRSPAPWLGTARALVRSSCCSAALLGGLRDGRDAGTRPLSALAVAAVVAGLILARWSSFSARGRFGGITGDGLGAVTRRHRGRLSLGARHPALDHFPAAELRL